MENRARFWIGATVLAGLLALVAGFRQRTRYVLGRSRVVWTLNYGAGLDDVGRARAIDGRDYGPLAFAVAGHGADATLWVADTYHQRILEVRAGRRPTAYPTPNAFLGEMAAAPGGTVYVGDNRRHQVLRLDHGRIAPVFTLPGANRVTEVVWRLAAMPAGGLLVDWIAVGEGQIRAFLDRVGPGGVQSLARGAVRGGEGPFRVEGMVQSVAVGPRSTIYMEPLGTTAGAQRIEKLTPRGEREGVVKLATSEPGAVLVGVDRRGLLYLLTEGSGAGSGETLWIYNPDGRLRTRLVSPQVASDTWQPVVVTDGGTVYWADSGTDRWKVLRYRWRAQKQWVWHLPFA